MASFVGIYNRIRSAIADECADDESGSVNGFQSGYASAIRDAANAVEALASEYDDLSIKAVGCDNSRHAASMAMAHRFAAREIRDLFNSAD